MKTGKDRMKMPAIVIWFSLLIVCFLPKVIWAGSGAALMLEYGYPNAVFYIYRIADERKQATDAFAGYGISLEGITNAQWQKIATELAEAVKDGHVASEERKATGDDGRVVFYGLESGWYLVTGEAVKTREGSFIPTPFVVNLQAGKQERADVKHYPDPDQPTEPEPTQPTEPEPTHPTEPEDPTSPSQPGGGSHDGGDRNEGEPEPSGQTEDAPHSDEPSVPASEEEVTYPEEQEEVPVFSLPQTGQLWWPVPILMLGGIVLLLLGIGKRRRENRIYEK